MPQKKQRYRATVAGKTYTILGTKSHHHMHSVIKLLNQQWDELATVAKKTSDTEKAILLAINAVSLQLDQQAEIERLKEEVSRLTVQAAAPKTTRKAAIPQERKAALEEQFEAQQDLIRK